MTENTIVSISCQGKSALDYSFSKIYLIGTSLYTGTAVAIS